MPAVSVTTIYLQYHQHPLVAKATYNFFFRIHYCAPWGTEPNVALPFTNIECGMTMSPNTSAFSPCGHLMAPCDKTAVDMVSATLARQEIVGSLWGTLPWNGGCAGGVRMDRPTYNISSMLLGLSALTS